jgi:hypothetical protein
LELLLLIVYVIVVHIITEQMQRVSVPIEQPKNEYRFVRCKYKPRGLAKD